MVFPLEGTLVRCTRYITATRVIISCPKCCGIASPVVYYKRCDYGRLRIVYTGGIVRAFSDETRLIAALKQRLPRLIKQLPLVRAVLAMRAGTADLSVAPNKLVDGNAPRYYNEKEAYRRPDIFRCISQEVSTSWKRTNIYFF